MGVETTGGAVDDAVRRARWLVVALFVVNGLAIGSFIARIPALQATLGLREGSLGTALLGAPLGTILAIVAAGALIARWGSVGVTIAGSVIGPAALALLPSAGSAVTLLAALAVLGAGLGAMDLGMNETGVAVERRLGRSVMVSFHGAWSIGALVGAGVGAATIAAGRSTAWHLTGAAVVLATAGLLTAVAARPFASGPNPAAKPRLALPRGAIAPLAALAVAATLAEGAIGDWGPLHLRDDVGASEAVAAASFTFFAAAMAAARVTGDHAVRRFGARTTARTGGVLAAVGYVVAVVGGTVPVVIAAYAVVGVGLGALFPLALAAGGRHAGGQGVAAVASVGYTGLLLGPPVVGWLAEATTLPTALLAVGGVAATTVLTGRALPATGTPA